MLSVGGVQFRLTYEINPILLSGGIAVNLPGGMIPILSMLQADLFDSILGLASGDFSLDDAFAHFLPLPGGTLIDNQIGMYPFANQQTAANAIITQPLQISMLMICPSRQAGDYLLRQSIVSALQATLSQHNILGGTYSIATPSFLYTDCVMTGMRDVSDTESKQPQNRWQLDFIKPLLSLAEAAQAQNTLMSKISSGTQLTNPAWSSPGNAVGQPPSGVTYPTIPAAQSSAGPTAGGGSLSIGAPPIPPGASGPGLG